MATMTTTDTTTPNLTTPDMTSATSIDLLHTTQAPAQRSNAALRLIERGLTTAEYAVGILGAMAAGLLLFRLFSDNRVFEAIFELIAKVLHNVTGQI